MNSLSQNFAEVIVNAISKLKYWKLAYLSKPVHNRRLYRAVIRNRVQSIMEIGLESLERSTALVQLARLNGSAVRYTGVDQFEASLEAHDALKLKEVHCQLKPHCARLQLLPGTLGSALAGIANAHLRTDLVIISAGYAPSELERALYFIPRMLHSGSTVLLQPSSDWNAPFESLSRLDIERRAEEMAARTKSPQAA